MVKMIFVRHKRHNMAEEEFRRYWRETHGPIAARIPGLKKYLQNHVLPDPPPGDGIDGIEELWFDNVESMQQALASPQAQAMENDAANCFDMGQSYHRVVEEVTIKKGVSSQVNSAITSIQQLMAIILGVGAANGLDLFFRMSERGIRLTGALSFREGSEYKLGEMSGLSTPSIVCLLLLLIMAFRFYHLNARYLDDSYRDKPSTARQWFLMVEFFAIFWEGILISSAGFFVDRPAALFLLFAMALVTDAIWAGVGLARNQVQDRKQATCWLRINGGCGVLVVAIVYFEHCYFVDINWVRGSFICAASLMFLDSCLSLLGFSRQLGFPDPSQT